MHSLEGQLVRDDKVRSVREGGTLPGEEVVGCFVGAEDDDVLAGHVEVEDGAVGFGPGVELEPWVGFGCLVEVADDGKGRWAGW